MMVEDCGSVQEMDPLTLASSDLPDLVDLGLQCGVAAVLGVPCDWSSSRCDPAPGPEEHCGHAACGWRSSSHVTLAAAGCSVHAGPGWKSCCPAGLRGGRSCVRVTPDLCYGD